MSEVMAVAGQDTEKWNIIYMLVKQSRRLIKTCKWYAYQYCYAVLCFSDPKDKSKRPCDRFILLCKRKKEWLTKIQQDKGSQFKLRRERSLSPDLLCPSSIQNAAWVNFMTPVTNMLKNGP